MLQECDGKKLYAVVLLSNHVQSYPKWFDLIYIFEATFNSEYWDHSLLIAWDRIYLHRQIQNLSDVYNTWFYADVPVKDVVCVGCFFVSCVFFWVSSCVFFFPLFFSLAFLVAVVLLWFLPSDVATDSPDPSGVSWMVPVDWCFFLLIIQGSRPPSWWTGGGWHEFKMGKQLVKDFGKCTGYI